jgi:hypothetical protein
LTNFENQNCLKFSKKLKLFVAPSYFFLLPKVLKEILIYWKKLWTLIAARSI